MLSTVVNQLELVFLATAVESEIDQYLLKILSWRDRSGYRFTPDTILQLGVRITVMLLVVFQNLLRQNLFIDNAICEMTRQNVGLQLLSEKHRFTFSVKFL